MVGLLPSIQFTRTPTEQTLNPKTIGHSKHLPSVQKNFLDRLHYTKQLVDRPLHIGELYARGINNQRRREHHICAELLSHSK